MYSAFVEVLGNCYKDNFTQMTGIAIEQLTVQKGEIKNIHFPMAQLITFEDSKNHLNGDFVIGLVDEQTTVIIASKIAEKMGLAPIPRFDEMAVDIINEFLNTVVGHTISLWDEIGLNVKFGPPSTVKDITPKISGTAATATYQITLTTDLPGSVVRLDGPQNDRRTLSLVVNFSTAQKTTQPVNKRVLIAEDSKILRSVMKKALENAGYKVEEACDGEEAVCKHRLFNPQLTLMDLVMPKLMGLDAIVQIQQFAPDARFIICSSISRRDEKVTASFLNVLHYIVKPMKIEDLVEKVANAFALIERQK